LLPEQVTTVHAMVMDHAAGCDMCILGGPGSGKTTVARAFAQILGYDVSTIHCFQDMTTRDLLQRRGTDVAGNTLWETTALVRACVLGEVAILDGTHRTPPDVLAVLQRLMHDRDLELFDGSRLLRADRYDTLAAAHGYSTAQMAALGIHRVHPAFRVVAVGEPPSAQGTAWLTSELLACWTFHTIPDFGEARLSSVLGELYPKVQPGQLHALVTFAQALSREAADSTSTLANSRPLSLRQLRRIASRMEDTVGDGVDGDVGGQIARALLLKFVPNMVAEGVSSLMAECGVPVASAETLLAREAPEVVQSTGRLSIGDVSIVIDEPVAPELIPKTLFYANNMHMHILREMLRDLEVFNERALLLIGNQGVGKNKLADHLLMLVQREREYLQLHRDTTVQSLTTSPSLEGGVVQWNDSPLVRAVRNGYVLVVDEADKAPVEVVTILKSLIEDAEMVLSDGKKIVPSGSPAASRARQDSSETHHPMVGNPDIIEMHPRFRMIVLANRPGFPFLGNDFFREIGDVLSCHIIDSPDKASELQLLRAYGPDVPESILQKLASAFDELRTANEQGLLAYPYSTREVVAIVKHLQAWPRDGLVWTLENVLSFDRFDKQLMQSLQEIFRRHAIPVGVAEGQVVAHVQELLSLGRKQHAETWTWAVDASIQCVCESAELQTAPFPLSHTVVALDTPATSGRISFFSEQLLRFQVPMEGYGTKAMGLTTNLSSHDGTDAVHVLTSSSPVPSLCSFGRNPSHCSTIFLQPQGGSRGFAGFGADVGALPDVCALPTRRGELCVHLPKNGHVVRHSYWGVYFFSA
jgi:MoxR-like ATPase